MFFLESELHRLVLGFLFEEAKCTSAANHLLAESAALREVAQVKRTRTEAAFAATLKVAGKSLVEHMNQHEE